MQGNKKMLFIVPMLIVIFSLTCLSPGATHAGDIIIVVDNSGSLPGTSNKARVAKASNWLRKKIQWAARGLWDSKENRGVAITVIPLGSPNVVHKTYRNYKEISAPSGLKSLLDFSSRTTHLNAAFQKALELARPDDTVVFISDFLADYGTDTSCSNFTREDYMDMVKVINGLKNLSSIPGKGARFFPIYIGHYRTDYFKKSPQLKGELKSRAANLGPPARLCDYNYQLAYSLAYHMAEKSGTHLGPNRVFQVRNAPAVENTLLDIFRDAGFPVKLPGYEKIYVGVRVDSGLPEDFRNYININGLNRGKGRKVGRVLKMCPKDIYYKPMKAKEKYDLLMNVRLNQQVEEEYWCQVRLKSPRPDCDIDTTIDLNGDNYSDLKRMYDDFRTMKLEENIISQCHPCETTTLTFEVLYDANGAGRFKPAQDYYLALNFYPETGNKLDTYHSSLQTDEDGSVSIQGYHGSPKFTLEIVNKESWGYVETGYKEDYTDKTKAKKFWKKYDLDKSYSVTMPSYKITMELPSQGDYRCKVEKKYKDSRQTLYFKETVKNKDRMTMRLPPGKFWVRLEPPSTGIDGKHYFPVEFFYNVPNQDANLKIETGQTMEPDKYIMVEDAFYEIFRERDSTPIEQFDSIAQWSPGLIPELDEGPLFAFWGHGIAWSKQVGQDMIKNLTLRGLTESVYEQWMNSHYPFHVLAWIVEDAFKPGASREKMKQAYDCLRIYEKLGMSHPLNLVEQDKKPNQEKERGVTKLAVLMWKCVLERKLVLEANSSLELRSFCMKPTVGNSQLIFDSLMEELETFAGYHNMSLLGPKKFFKKITEADTVKKIIKNAQR